MKIIFLGIQGSGKSTQAKILSEKLNLPYIEMGQLLRDRLSEKSEEAYKIKRALTIGNLVPDQIAINTLKKRIQESDFDKGFILDGYPRNLVQLKSLPGKFDKVFYIELSQEEAIKRLTLRSRRDDKPKVIERRVSLFFQETKPIIEFFQKEGTLIEIDGKPSIEKVSKAIESQMIKKNEINKN